MVVILRAAKGPYWNPESTGALSLEVGKGSGNFLEDVIPEIVFSRLWEFSRKKALERCHYSFQGCILLFKS